MIVITSGSRYIDIDAYATCIAYREFLKLKGIESYACSTSVINESITPSILDYSLKLDDYEPSEGDTFIVIDVSDEDFFDKHVIKENIIEVIDHHTGYEELWKERLNDKAQIEYIGAVATLIFEKYEDEGLTNNISIELAKLLMAAILDNTLNFMAKVTTERDKIAYKKLSTLINNYDFSKEYFEEVEEVFKSDIEAAIINDTKTNVANKMIPKAFSQIVLYDKSTVLNKIDSIFDRVSKVDEDFMINMVSLSDGKSFILANSDAVKNNMEKLFNKKFNGDILELSEVWLRKEIIKEASDFIENNNCFINNLRL